MWLLSIRTNRDLNWLTLLSSCLLINKHCSKLEAFPDRFVLGNHSFNPFLFLQIWRHATTYSLNMRISTFLFVQMWRHGTTYSWRWEVMSTHQFTNALFFVHWMGWILSLGTKFWELTLDLSFFIFLLWFLFQLWPQLPWFKNSKYYPPFSPTLSTHPFTYLPTHLPPMYLFIHPFFYLPIYSPTHPT